MLVYCAPLLTPSLINMCTRRPFPQPRSTKDWGTLRSLSLLSSDHSTCRRNKTLICSLCSHLQCDTWYHGTVRTNGFTGFKTFNTLKLIDQAFGPLTYFCRLDGSFFHCLFHYLMSVITHLKLLFVPTILVKPTEATAVML